MNLQRLAPLLILFCVAPLFAQESKCTLKLSELPDAPEMFGFRNGMTTEQVKTKVPPIVFGRANEFGVVQTSISPDFDPRFDKAAFAGIRTVSLDFLDNRLMSIWLGFDGTFKWQTVPDFVAGISQSMRVPAGWSTWKIRGQRLKCADFEMTVTMVGEGPSFRLLDTTAEQVVAARRQAKEDLESSEETAAVEIVADKQGKVYYAEGCQPAQSIKESNRVVFNSVADAEKAGYKPARTCQ